MAKQQKTPSEMTHKGYVKYLNTLTDEQCEIELSNTDRFWNKPFIREAYSKLDGNKRRLFIKNIAEERFYHTYIKKFAGEEEIAYDVLKYKKEQQDGMRRIRNFLDLFLKYINPKKFMEILIPNNPEAQEIITILKNNNFRVLIIDKLLEGEKVENIVNEMFKRSSTDIAWILKYKTPAYFTYNVNHPLFKKYLNIEYFKMNPRSLFCLIYYARDILTKEEYDNVLQYLKKTITYKRTYMSDLPLTYLTEEEQNYLNSAVMIKQLAETNRYF